MTDLDKLATAMGYVKISNYTGSFADQQGTEHWTHPDVYVVFEVPDPKNDANDCNALIKHLNELGATVKVEHTRSGMKDYVRVYYNHMKGIECDNWMHGVCELALKVIDAHSGQPHD